MGKKKRKYDKGASVGFLMALPTVLGLILLNIYRVSSEAGPHLPVKVRSR